MQRQQTFRYQDHGRYLNKGVMGVFVTSEISLQDAWDTFAQNRELQQKFAETSSVFHLGSHEDGPTPKWAYWFARHVIGDYWPDQEELIAQDADAGGRYRIYKSFLITSGIMGWTTSTDKLNHMFPQAASDLMRSERLAPAGERAARREEMGRHIRAGMPYNPAPLTKRELNQLADSLADVVDASRPTGSKKPKMEVSKKKKVDLDEDFGGDDGI